MEKFIYLDWNVIQYCKNPHESEIYSEFLALINDLKRKYKFPFTEGQLLDLSVSSNDGKIDKNIQEDLNVLKNISDSWALGYNHIDEPQLVQIDDIDIEFYKILDKKNERIATKMMPNFNPIKIDLSKINENDLYYKFIYKNNGYLSSEVLDDILQHMTDVFDDTEKYKKIRNEFMNLRSTIVHRENTFLDESTILFNFIIDYLSFIEIDNIQKLEEKFIGILEQHFILIGKNYTCASLKEKIETGIMLLDFNRSFTEKITKKNKLRNMTRDCKHICMASDAEYFITEDNSTYKKGKFIYKILNVKTKINKMNEFCYNFL